MIGAPNDFGFEVWPNFRQGLVESRPLIGSVGNELLQERMHPKQGRKEQNAAVAILDIGGMNDGMEQQTQRIYEDVPLLALDLLARIIAMRIDAGPPCMGPFLSSGFRAAHLS